MIQGLEDTARKQLDDAVTEEDRRELHADATLITSESPAREIAHYASEHQIDLIVIGTHGRSGLIDKVKASTTTEAEAEAELLAFLKKWVPKSKSPMCGNSICQDRRFMARYMPKLEEYFHYRNLDVSTLKELCKRWQPAIAKGFTKHQRHTAFADIIESIEELRYYREHFIRDVPQTPDAEALASSVAP